MVCFMISVVASIGRSGLFFKYLLNIFSTFSYTLNREPKQFETVRFLVDGSHWSSKKKDKRGGGGGGHLGCATSYNFNLYRPFISDDIHQVNSQGREQMHSILKKLAPSLRQKNYFMFMNYCIMFFCINNLNKMGKI